MNALESPLEALAIDYLTYGFLTAVNNIWAWLAVITAAVSFWRIRASSFTPELNSRNQDAPSTSGAPSEVSVKTSKKPATASLTPNKALFLSAQTKACCRTLERDGSTKMKFSLYYEEDFRDDDEGGEREDGDGRAPVISRDSDKWFDDWERMMVMRMGDMGWYRWQDTTVLDGSVVRLWEGRRQRQTASLLVGVASRGR